MVHPDRVLTNGGARAGDQSSSPNPWEPGSLPRHERAPGIAGRLRRSHRSHDGLERLPAACLEAATVHAVTDITGFGLLGHALEMAAASQVEITFWAHQVPVLAAAKEYAAMGLVPGGTLRQPQSSATSTSRWPRTSIPAH